eukprot:CAMPEP_0171482744 /NCGR_PEP_ID=MMETSP0946-20130122/7683_1 /TAXON_ID=109269 /ORGANISM="Vaucheria litorea, Strain CCMP2940" /LENGTH=42 /DNA_ID= /DNA_START= /DNA_END= /DNA_ORIENTATION=
MIPSKFPFSLFAFSASISAISSSAFAVAKLAANFWLFCWEMS